MKLKLIRKWSMVAALALASAGFGLPSLVRADEKPADQQHPIQVAQAGTAAPAGTVASGEQLRSEALRALEVGQFDQTRDLILKAAKLSPDPTTEQMSSWVTDFEGQRKQFAAERQKQFDKAAADVRKLIDNHKESFALDQAARAYSLAPDKDAFRKEPWVDDLIKSTAKMAQDCEASEQWLKTLRLYSDLTQIEPANPQWKDRLKLASRRVRLLAVYTPDALRTIQESEWKERDEADQILNPTTQPATRPAALQDGDAFKIDWKDQLRGIDIGMLRTALIEARSNYWREVDFKTLMTGGIRGIQALAGTRGLEAAFPTLGDEAKRSQFMASLNEAADVVSKGTPNTDPKLLAYTLDSIKRANDKTVQLPQEVIVNEFADGAFADLDQFTSMIWPADLDDFNKSTQGEFSGVGIQIQMDEDNSLKVISPLEDSPAWKQGVRADDTIVGINGKSTKGITINQAVKNITGIEGTPVDLRIRTVTKDGPVEKDYHFIRQKIKVASLKGWQREPGGTWNYFIDPKQKIGYLRLTNFTKTSGEELDRAVAELQNQGARAIILDLRDNPGGLLTAATDVADKFLKEGTIVSTKTDPSRDAPVAPPMEAHRTPDDCDLPLVVLTNQYSASASEIVSGALKDWKRATIVGERTFGKGSVQMLFPLRDRTAYLKLTTSHYYLPLGRCIHREENSTCWGVDPDVLVEMTPEQKKAAINARQAMDVLRDAVPALAEAPAVNVKPDTAAPATQPAQKDLLSVDPQLNAALLLLRMQLADHAEVAAK